MVLGGDQVSDERGEGVMPTEQHGTQTPDPAAQKPPPPASRKRYGFFGAYNHSVDAKGRMIVPQPFREKLGTDIIVGVNFAQNSIAIYPYDVWEKKLDLLTSLAEQDVSAEVFLERFSMLSFDNCSFDTQGRVLLPSALREMFLKDAQGVQVSGAREYIKVVSSEQAQRDADTFYTEHGDVLRAISAIQARVRQAHINDV